MALICMTGGLAGCGQENNDENIEVIADEPAGTVTAGTSGAAGTMVPYKPMLPSEKEEAEIFVEPISGLTQDFIKGMDLSSIIAQEDSGVVYYGENGMEQDIFRTLADAGVNYIRVRVWNDPYDKDGNGYGGGNNDVQKAVIIGRRAAENGMKLLVDFHYSDFWADPNKQFAPKEWQHLTFEDKKEALYLYTKESLQAILDNGADVGMVQIGNEINNGLAGETDSDRILELLKQGSKAVREVAAENGKDIKIAVHYTEIDDYDQTMRNAKALSDGGLDYDVFGVSYYPFWHGSMENLTKVLQDINSTYGKETVVLETSYAYTLEDGDGFANSVGEDDLTDGYVASVQSQAACIRDVMAAASEADALGVFYWEGAWIPVGQDTAQNQILWEEYGSGWASSYAAKYDPNDAGLYYGGSSWDNQALFDWKGNPLASLNVFKYVNYGTSCEPAVDYLEETEIKVNIGEELVMPEGVWAVYNDRSLSQEVSVLWDAEQVAAIDTSNAGEYVIDGTLEDGSSVTCAVTIENVNWMENPSFEETNVTMWEVTYEGAENPTDIQNKPADCITGDYSFHFWSELEQEFKVEQTVSGLAAGDYTAAANIQGGDVGSSAEIYLYVVVNGEEIKSEPIVLTGWCNWQSPAISDISLDGASDITVGMAVKCAGGGWGTMDDFTLYKQ